MRVRFPATWISILSLMLGLVYSPFFHVHTGHTDGEEAGVLHAHFFGADLDHESEDRHAGHDGNSGPAFDAEHPHRHGSDCPLSLPRARRSCIRFSPTFKIPAFS